MLQICAFEMDRLVFHLSFAESFFFINSSSQFWYIPNGYEMNKIIIK